MRPKGRFPAFYSTLALAALALLFATNAAAVSESVIHNFTIYPHGANPVGNLVADAAGNLYGTSAYGGKHGYGAVFQLTRKPDGKWVETLTHSFDGSPAGVNNGFSPSGGLTFDASGNLYGTTQSGGNLTCGDGCGTVFELTPIAGGKWSYSVIYRFKGKDDGNYPYGGVVLDAAGNLYGTTDNLVSAMVFELIRSSSGWRAKPLYNFGSVLTPANLTIDAGGKLYGALHGLSNDNGIFELVPHQDGKWTENTLCGTCTATGVPAFDQAGNLYVGTRDQVLELVRKQNWKMIAIATFSATEGSYVTGALTFDQNGNLYGTTLEGGDINACKVYGVGYGCGTAFELAHKKNGWQVSILHAFKGNRDGAGPSAGMIFDGHGNLYGATGAGGDPLCGSNPNIPGCGTVFELTPTSSGHWKQDVIDRFELGDGSGPPSGLVADASGNLYGTMSQGIGGGCGMVYELTPSPRAGWKEHVLYQFKCGSDGRYPGSSVIFDSAGNLYGTTLAGGSTGLGTVFELKPSATGPWTESVLYSFTGNADGYQPGGAVVFDAAGNLYGTTASGGIYNCWDSAGHTGCGASYELSPTPHGTWTETTLHTFMGYPSDGAFPASALVVDQAGNLFGTTTQGGNVPCINRFQNYGCGTVFELSPGAGGVWTENVISNSPGMPGGASPNGLTLDSQGNLYGTAGGGNNCRFFGCGTAYELSPASGGHWTATVLYNFGGFASDGQLPLGSLTFDKSGNLYGTTFYGGSSSSCQLGCGTVFELSPSSLGGWTESILYSFNGPYKDGESPATGVFLDAAGEAYGTTSAGGLYSFGIFGGVVFEISP